VADPTWPVTLTDKDWQKKKGNISKLAGETGIGDAMDDAEKAFDKIDWKKFDAREILPQDRDISNLKALKSAAGDYYKSTVEPVRVKVKKIKDLAEKTAAEWKKKTLIPSSARKAAEAVASEADKFWLTLKGNSSTFDEYMKTFDTMIAVKEKNAIDEAKKLDVTIANLETALKDFAKAPTKAAWSTGNTSSHQRCRSMCNSIRNIPALKDEYWSTWQKFGDEYHRDAPDGGEEETAAMKTKGQTVWKALATFKANYRKVMAG